jgi:hypothetical protein
MKTLKERKAAYNEFKKVQPVTTYYMSPEDIDAYLTAKYTKNQLRFASGHICEGQGLQQAVNADE